MCGSGYTLKKIRVGRYDTILFSSKLPTCNIKSPCKVQSVGPNKKMCGSGYTLKKIRVGRYDTIFFPTFFLGIFRPAWKCISY